MAHAPMAITGLLPERDSLNSLIFFTAALLTDPVAKLMALHIETPIAYRPGNTRRKIKPDLCVVNICPYRPATGIGDQLRQSFVDLKGKNTIENDGMVDSF